MRRTRQQRLALKRRKRRIATACFLASLLAGVTVAQAAISRATHLYVCLKPDGTPDGLIRQYPPAQCKNPADQVVSWEVDSPLWNATTTTVKATTTTVKPPQPGTTASTTLPPTSTTIVPPTGMWKPSSAHSITWDWVIGAKPNTSENVAVMDMDGFDNSAADVAAFHAHGTKVICYLDLGTYEPGRPDLGLIPQSAIGSDVQGWPGEKWLNTGDLNALKPLIDSRITMCKNKGFDAVEPDNIDGFSNNTGFSISAAQQATYNKYIADKAHSLGLSVGLKNDVEQISTLQPSFDWALNEECNAFDECDGYSAFTNAGKAVFNAEYEGGTGFCANDAAKKINGGAFDLDLGTSGHTACPAW